MTALSAPTAIVPQPSAVSAARRRALLAGVMAGPIFVTTAVVQILTRDGYDLARHPLSLLANGSYGWVQSANFVLAGLLSLVFAYAVVPHLRGGRGAVAGPVLLAVYGAGLIIGGVFKADPAMGFPAGAPAGYPGPDEHLQPDPRVRSAAGLPGPGRRLPGPGPSLRGGG